MTDAITLPKTPRILWTTEEQNTVFSKAREIQKDLPEISLQRLWTDAQTVLPEDRRRPLRTAGGVAQITKTYRRWTKNNSMAPMPSRGRPPGIQKKPKRKYTKRAAVSRPITADYTVNFCPHCSQKKTSNFCPDCGLNFANVKLL